MRDSSDLFALSAEHFVQLSRFNKQLARDLFGVIRPHMHNCSNDTAINPMICLFTPLYFYATGIYQRVVG